MSGMTHEAGDIMPLQRAHAELAQYVDAVRNGRIQTYTDYKEVAASGVGGHHIAWALGSLVSHYGGEVYGHGFGWEIEAVSSRLPTATSTRVAQTLRQVWAPPEETTMTFQGDNALRGVITQKRGNGHFMTYPVASSERVRRAPTRMNAHEPTVSQVASPVIKKFAPLSANLISRVLYATHPPLRRKLFHFFELK